MHFVRYFKRLGQVDLAYSSRNQESTPICSPFEREIQLTKGHRSRLGRLVRLRRIPLLISELTRFSQHALISAIKDKDYDYILVRYVRNAAALFHLPTQYMKRTIIDFDDLLSGALYDDRFDSVSAPHKRVIMALNRRYLRRYERRCLRFGATLFCSRADVSTILNTDKNNAVFVVPNIYPSTTIQRGQLGSGLGNGNVLLFVGFLSYGPNMRGLRWFLECVFPNFQKEYHDARLMVAGKLPTPELSRICHKTKGVELYADPIDIRWCYMKCRAVVVPLLAGSGTRIKILEAALARRPVLSTPLGAKGLDFVDQKDILLFENAAQFNRQYKRLLDVAAYQSMTEKAEQHVLSNYSAEQFNRAMDPVLVHIEIGKHLDRNKHANEFV